MEKKDGKERVSEKGREKVTEGKVREVFDSTENRARTHTRAEVSRTGAHQTFTRKGTQIQRRGGDEADSQGDGDVKRGERYMTYI